MKNFVLVNGVFGVFNENTNIFTEDNQIINKRIVPYENVDWKKVPHKTRKLLVSILELRCKRIDRQKKQEECQESIEEMEKMIEELRIKKAELENERKEIQKEINNLAMRYSEDKKLTEIKKTVKGNEIEKMSFYDGTLDVLRAKAILLKSKRPITYTYGLSYRNPTTFHVPKTIEEAFSIIENEGFLDITFGKYEIHLNAFSCNDMW